MIFSKRSTAPRKVINALLEGEKTLTELTRAVEISKQALLKHLNKLEEQGFIQSNPSPGSNVQKSYSLIAKTILLSINKNGYAISCSNQGFIDEKYPLLIQIPQPSFREELRNYLVAITKSKWNPSVIVYGSVAKGKAGNESDLDLSLVKSSWEKTAREELTDILSGLMVEQGLPHSLSLEFQTYKDLESPTTNIQREIVDQGILVDTGHSTQRGALWRILKRYRNI